MISVTIDGKEYSANEGERLSELLIRTGNAIPMPCGGRGTCGKCRVTVDGQPILACQYRIGSDIAVELPAPETIVSETGAAVSGTLTGDAVLALDVGTTTLALALVSRGDGQIVRVVTRPNPQRAFGADVMSRIAYSTGHGVSALQQAVLGAVGEMLRELDAPGVGTMFVAGNTTMLHLFFGADPSGMGSAPYTPAFLNSQTVTGESLGFSGVRTVVSLPCAASFVGADLTAGLDYVGLPPEGKYRVLLDLGTNAEVILFSHEAAVCTAAAAGPCFEGANISCGMSASAGAICAYDAQGFRTIGGAPPVGVCGTGLVDVIATLLSRGRIDGTGYMARGSFPVAPGVALTQADVRQYQLAKAAVSAALQTLLQKQGVQAADVDALYISGGFSAKINVGNAVVTGLLPAAFRDKCVPLGNTSLLGTAKYACKTGELAVSPDRMQYVDLTADTTFSDLFIGNMSFAQA